MYFQSPKTITHPTQHNLNWKLYRHTSHTHTDRGHINQSEVDRVKELINALQSRQYLLSDVVLPSEDTLCTICYSQSISATFDPCKHQSCSGCITQHLMNSRLCFYCKATITSVINFDGNVIHEHVAPSTGMKITSIEEETPASNVASAAASMMS